MSDTYSIIEESVVFYCVKIRYEYGGNTRSTVQYCCTVTAVKVKNEVRIKKVQKKQSEYVYGQIDFLLLLLLLLTRLNT